jgi:hypothetical protein
VGYGRMLAVAALAAALVAPASPALAHNTTGAADRLVLERSGGFAGVQDSFVVDRSVVGGAKPLRLAGSVGFRRLRAAYRPSNPCCDRFSYRITAFYAGGSRKTVATTEGAAAPQILWDVIGLTQRVGRRGHPAGPTGIGVTGSRAPAAEAPPGRR